MHDRCRRPVGAETRLSYPATFAENESTFYATNLALQRFANLLPSRLKCDRGMPCEACARRGLSLSCTYPVSTPLQSGKRLIDPSSSDIHGKIANLEKLVLSMKRNENAPGNAPSAGSGSLDDSSQLHKSFGRIGLENTETNYVEGSHWTAILDGVREPILYHQIMHFRY